MRRACFRTCTYKHTHGHHANTLHTRETIKVSLAKRNTPYVCSWICTIKCVHVCVYKSMFSQKCNRTFCTWAYVPYLKRVCVCVCEWWCLFTRMTLRVPRVHVLVGLVTWFFLDQTPPPPPAPHCRVLSAFHYFDGEVQSRWDTEVGEKPAVFWNRAGWAAELFNPCQAKGEIIK